jgi:valyl-tRNA synthetase
MTYSHRMTPLPQAYDTAATEKKWQQHWLERKTYAWDAAESRENSYVIDTPPPTVSGHLHMGHVFSYTQADFIARYQRMSGKNVFYPMGFDDNGLPTERLVEKAIKKRAVDMSREDFIAECLKVSEEARRDFRDLFQSIALSVDWAQEYHTISDDARRLSQLSFLDLVKKDQCYRAMRPFYWDPVDQTAIAQAEIVDREMASFQNIILFEIEGQKLPVMTTRPELLPACVALMYHPDDDAKYKGKTARTPLFNIEVPMVADEKVDKEKGTGLVMCCTFGDDTDKEWWEKHKLADRVILNKHGKLDPTLLKNTGIADALIDAIQNKKVSNSDPKHLGARETIVNMLKEAGLLTEQKPVTHAVKCAERSGAPLEILPTEQWFVRVTDKKSALTAKARECTWHPEWMRVRMEQWIEGLNQDWCISRQRYFGVPFPVWYEIDIETQQGFFKPVTAVYADSDQLPVNPLVDTPKGYQKIPDPTIAIDGFSVSNGNLQGKIYVNPEGKRVALVPDTDVMDTWATSSISPQLSAHGITAEQCDDPARFAKLYPADLRPQAHEIIRTWAFYTLVKSHLHSNSIPWKNLMISGWCLAEDKTKMSKSKGNVVTPVALIEERGTDAVRYWAATSRLGQDTAFSPDLLKIGKKLVGKLWNATQFAAIHLDKLESQPGNAAGDNQVSETIDRWILSRLSETVSKATAAFQRYEYADALDATNQFFWADFCDNYLELIKKRVYNEDRGFTSAQQQSAIRALYHCLLGILKLYAPFTPHVTEELYSHIFTEDYADKDSLHARFQWPNPADYRVDAVALRDGQYALEMLELIRKAKSDSNRSIKFPIDGLGIFITEPGAADSVRAVIADVMGAGNVRNMDISSGSAEGMLKTPSGNIALTINFAPEADAA